MADVFKFLIALGLGCLFVAGIFTSLWLLFVNREKFVGFIMFVCIIVLAGGTGIGRNGARLIETE